MLESIGELSSVVSDQDELDLLKVLVNPLSLLNTARSCDLSEFATGTKVDGGSGSDSVHSPAPGTGRRSSFNSPRSQFVAGVDSQLEEAWAALRKSLVLFRGQRVGTIAANDNSEENLNYDQVFVRDFIPSGLAYLMNGEPEIVKNFILKTLRLQALFFMALRCAQVLLKQDEEGKDFVERIAKRLHALTYHMRNYFWLDLKQLNDIYRYKTEEYSHTAVNKFNVMPDSLPEWIFDFMPTRGGYFIGNVSPARMDFRWFCLGNCVAILSSLATPEQSTAIMDLIESRWEELVGEMPLKVCYPALESHEWRIVTGCDPKNTRWSYHNGGSWPVLLWLLTAACIKTGRPQIARRAVELAESRLGKDSWPEYYDGKLGRFVGKQARKYQTWSVAGYLVAKLMLEDPSHLGMVALEEDKQMRPIMKRSNSWTFGDRTARPSV
ncbi:Probable alkaline/neutral invertase B [Linum perenne]